VPGVGIGVARVGSTDEGAGAAGGDLLLELLSDPEGRGRTKPVSFGNVVNGAAFELADGTEGSDVAADDTPDESRLPC